MSPEDLDARKGQILLEFQKVEDQIAGISAVLEGIAELHADFAERLRHAPETNLYMPNQAHHGFSVTQYNIHDLPRLADWQKAFDLVDELRVAKARLAVLRDQKMRLGLR